MKSSTTRKLVRVIFPGGLVWLWTLSAFIEYMPPNWFTLPLFAALVIVGALWIGVELEKLV